VAELAAFLRGINVGGHRVTGPELRAPFEALGLTGVATFRASGNVVFAARTRPRRARAHARGGARGALGYAVATFVRTADELRAMASHQPFRPAELEASKGKLQVMLLREALSARDRKAVLALAPSRTAWRSRDASSTGCRAAAP
jgi:uncharacterized protein (DUF1697 family)